MPDQLRYTVYEANQLLVKHGLVIFTWGNVSGIDRKNGRVAIKPSGISYEEMTVEDIVIVDLEGKLLDGRLKPSSDTPTHLFLYKKFKEINGIVHTHSRMATVWAQAGISIPALGTTHADHFYGDIPCTRPLNDDEIAGNYELATGEVIAETFASINPMDIPAVLVCNHGPFCWGKDAATAVANAVILEEIATMAYYTQMLHKQPSISAHLLEKHFQRKHGKNAYYGQKDSKN